MVLDGENIMCGLYQKCCDRPDLCPACVDHPPRTVTCALATCEHGFRPECPTQLFCSRECYERSGLADAWESHLEQAKKDGRFEPRGFLLKVRAKRARQKYRSSEKGKQTRREGARRHRAHKREMRLRSNADDEEDMRGSSFP